ncbi:MAG: RsmF rRNA methyltransferase first C-terminal domain-containing protein [Lachnospiraceae bacterium]
MNLPAAFEEKIKKLLGTEYEAYLACFGQPRLYGLRVNTKKISIAEFKKICPFDIKPIPWIENGFYYDGEHVSPAKHPYYFAGLYYLQEPSAMTPANRLPVEPGDKVLDICAAPGGKSTELGAKLGNEGVLVANDISNSRAKGLLKNIEVFGIGNVLVLSEEPGRLVDYFTGYFDKILIDAPCSGEGMFRKEKKMIRAWEEHGPDFFAKIQRDILLKSAKMLKPGGMLLYSTCTFDPEENEGAVAYLLAQFPEFEICEMTPYDKFAEGRPELLENGTAKLKNTVRIWPHKMGGEGHYLALLRRGDSLTETTVQPTSWGKGERVLPTELTAFFENISWTLDSRRLDIHGERVYYMPQDVPDVKGLRFLRTGLLLGELKKNRFEPSQALAMSLKAEEYRHVISFSSDDERTIRYLKGETLSVADLTNQTKGWQLICADGYPLGWGKLASGMLKNKYLPGWRWK